MFLINLTLSPCFSTFYLSFAFWPLCTSARLSEKNQNFKQNATVNKWKRRREKQKKKKTNTLIDFLQHSNTQTHNHLEIWHHSILLSLSAHSVALDLHSVKCVLPFLVSYNAFQHSYRFANKFQNVHDLKKRIHFFGCFYLLALWLAFFFWPAFFETLLL